MNQKDELIGARFDGECFSLSYLGLGEVKHLGKLIYVPDFYPEEKGMIEIEYKRNGQYFGKVISLSERSKGRTEPECVYFKRCGGCIFQDYSYELEKEHKRKLIINQFHKIAGIDVDVLPTIGMEKPFNYRNKIQLHFGKDKNGATVLGFYKEGTHNVLPIKKCLIEDARGEDVANKILSIVKTLDIEPYNENDGTGEVRHLLIRTSHSNNQILCAIVTKNANFPAKKRLIELIRRIAPEITTLIQSVNKAKTNVVLGEKDFILYGPGYIEDELCGLSFKISTRSFYQVNPIMTETLYRKAMDFATLTKDDVVFDAYSGIGTIGLVAAKDAKRVISVELVPEAVKDAKENAKRNHITNFDEYEEDATKFIQYLVAKNEHIDVLFMDPPRKGSTEEFIEAVKALKPTRIVYVSCGPSTLARDVKMLSSDYDVKAVQPIDLFPRTAHTENVCLLTLKK